MADSAATFQGLPIELRHQIYGYVSVREDKPKKLIRRWFEKRDVAAQIAKHSATPHAAAVTAVAAYVDEDEDDSEAAEEEQDDEDEDGEEDDDDEDGDNDDEEAEVDVENDEEADVDAEHDDEVDAEAVDQDAEGEQVDENGDVAMANDDDGTTTAPPAAPALPVQNFYPAAKWRHIPKFIRIDRFPPATELLLTSQQINREVKDWYYDTAVLKINATASFLHTSFFEESLEEIADAAFSPMENIRKVEVTFVWDTAWLREDGHDWGAAIFPALLDQRSKFVLKILQRAPDLKELVVHWHDSCNDGEAEETKHACVTPLFEQLPDVGKFLLREYYIERDAKVEKRSLAGIMRLEFQAIADNGWNVK